MHTFLLSSEILQSGVELMCILLPGGFNCRHAGIVIESVQVFRAIKDDLNKSTQCHQ